MPWLYQADEVSWGFLYVIILNWQYIKADYTNICLFLKHCFTPPSSSWSKRFNILLWNHESPLSLHMNYSLFLKKHWCTTVTVPFEPRNKTRCYTLLLEGNDLLNNSVCWSTVQPPYWIQKPWDQRIFFSVNRPVILFHLQEKKKKQSLIKKLRKRCHVAAITTNVKELPPAFLKCSSYTKNWK